MKWLRPSPSLAMAVIVSQLLGPGTLWAVEQRGVRLDTDRLVVSAVSGDQLTIQNSSGTQSAKFRTIVQVGDRVVTGARTVAEILISDRTVMTLDPETTVQVMSMSAAQTTIQLPKGMVRVAAAASAIGTQGLVQVQTPTSQVQTRGGIVRVAVDVPVSKVGTEPTGAQVYRASYRSDLHIAATPSSSGDLIHVEEGTADIAGAGLAGGPLALQAGQRVMVQAGRAGTMAEGRALGIGTTGILATTSHTQTPKEGRDHLVALQVNQATQLSKALTGAAETGEKESDKKSDTKNVINGATGGVTIQTGGGTVQDAFAKAFGTGPNAYSGTGGSAVNQSGTGAVDDSNDAPNRVLVGSSAIDTKGGAGLLLFTERNPARALYDVPKGFDPENPDSSRSNPYTFKRLNFGPDSVKSEFVATKELLVIDGGERLLTHHEGRTPTSILIVRGVVGSNESLELQIRDSFTAYDSATNGGTRIDTIAAAEGVSTTAGTYQTANGQAFLNNRGTDVLAKMIDANAQVLLSKADGDSRQVVENKNYRFVDGRLIDEPCNSQNCYIAGSSALSDYSRHAKGIGTFFRQNGDFESFIDGSITARSIWNGSVAERVVLTGGVVLDRSTTVTIGETFETSRYFNGVTGVHPKANLIGDKFNGALLSVLASNRDTGDVYRSAFVKIQDRALGVLDGSSITETTDKKTALLSVLDSRLIGPEAKDPSTGANGRKQGEIVPLLEFDGMGQAKRTTTKAEVTSAVVVRATDVPLDGALLTASSPLLAMMNATVSTKGHFADLAGNNGRPALLASLVPGDALVRLNNATLTVAGNLLNLNNATAAITGYLFSLDNGSMLQIDKGSLFSLTSSSNLTLTGKAFGVFGDEASKLTITNNLCSTGPCGDLVNSAGQDIKLNGATLRVAGVGQDVVLPNNFNVFAGNDAAKVTIGKDAALFKVDTTSTLTINGAKVR